MRQGAWSGTKERITAFGRLVCVLQTQDAPARGRGVCEHSRAPRQSLPRMMPKMLRMWTNSVTKLPYSMNAPKTAFELMVAVPSFS